MHLTEEVDFIKKQQQKNKNNINKRNTWNNEKTKATKILKTPKFLETFCNFQLNFT